VDPTHFPNAAICFTADFVDAVLQTLLQPIVDISQAGGVWRPKPEDFHSEQVFVYMPKYG
jgi:hypothetical protein